MTAGGRQDRSFTLRIALRDGVQLGPGKAELLQGIMETGSIAAAGRRMRMSYKRAWSLLDAMNRCFPEPLVSASKGGAQGGGARLTPAGHAVLDAYRRMEAATARTVADEFAVVHALLAPRDD